MRPLPSAPLLLALACAHAEDVEILDPSGDAGPGAGGTQGGGSGGGASAAGGVSSGGQTSGGGGGAASGGAAAGGGGSSGAAAGGSGGASAAGGSGGTTPPTGGTGGAAGSSGSSGSGSGGSSCASVASIPGLCGADPTGLPCTPGFGAGSSCPSGETCRLAAAGGRCDPSDPVISPTCVDNADCGDYTQCYGGNCLWVCELGGWEVMCQGGCLAIGHPTHGVCVF